MRPLALVKGELGTRDTEAPYITIHRELQGLWTGLKNLEAGHTKQGETLCFCQDRVDHLVTDTRVAWGRSNEAMHAVEQLVNVGGHAKVSLLESQLVMMCHKPPRYVPYKGTYVPYDGTYGASDQGQTLDV